MKIHVCLISDQTLQNLIPALMERPDIVWMVVSAQMHKRGLDARLKGLLRQMLDDPAVIVKECLDVPDTGMPSIRKRALALAEEIDATYEDAKVTLNATGGTKLMAIGFIEEFRSITDRIIYTDTRNRRIEFLPAQQQSRPEEMAIPDVLDVKLYLAAQGFLITQSASDDIEWRSRSNARKQAAKYLGKHAEQLGDFIGALNGLADKALEKIPGSREEVLKGPLQNLTQTPRGVWADALRVLVEAKILSWQEGSRDIAFYDVERTKFVRGVWLEEYAWHVIRDERAYDVRHAVQIQPTHTQATENEIDVLAVHSNQLLVIECKTLRFREGENDNDLAYRIDSLGRAARGLFGETWLLSARKPTPSLEERARENRFRIVGPADLARFRDTVKIWMRGPA